MFCVTRVVECVLREKGSEGCVLGEGGGCSIGCIGYGVGGKHGVVKGVSRVRGGGVPGVEEGAF